MWAWWLNKKLFALFTHILPSSLPPAPPRMHFGLPPPSTAAVEDEAVGLSSYSFLHLLPLLPEWAHLAQHNECISLAWVDSSSACFWRRPSWRWGVILLSLPDIKSITLHWPLSYLDGVCSWREAQAVPFKIRVSRAASIPSPVWEMWVCWMENHISTILKKWCRGDIGLEVRSLGEWAWAGWWFEFCMSCIRV